STIYLSRGAGLLRATRARNGGGRRAVDWRLLRNKSARRRSSFESDRRTQAGESEGGDGDAAARSEGERPVHSGSRSPKRTQMCDVKRRGATTDLPFLPGTKVCQISCWQRLLEFGCNIPPWSKMCLVS